MPAGIPSGAKPGAPPLIASNPFAYPITYPSPVGTLLLTVNLLPFMTVGTQSRQMTAPGKGAYSDAWLEIINFSDSLLSPIFDTGIGPEPPIPPGYVWSVPIPLSATKLTATVLMQTSTQQFPNELAFATFYTASDLASGHVPRNGQLVPSVPAGSIGPGTLPPGVIVPDAQQIDVTHASNTQQPQIVADANSGFSLFPDATNNRIWLIPTETNATAYGMALGRVDSAQAAHLDGPYVDSAGNWTIQSGQLVLAVPVGGAEPRVYWTAANPDLLVLSPKLGGANQNGIVVQCWDGASQFNPLSIGPVQLGAAPTWIGKDGHFGGVAGQTTAGAFGVPVIVAQALPTNVTTTTLQTLISYGNPAGVYRAHCTLEIGNTTASIKPALKITFTDKRGAPDQVWGIGENASVPTTVTTIDGVSYSFPATFGAVAMAPTDFAANAGTITVTYQTGGTPNDYVGCILERLA